MSDKPVAMLTRIRKTYREFPLSFRVLVGAAFIDRIGGAMLYPLLPNRYSPRRRIRRKTNDEG